MNRSVLIAVIVVLVAAIALVVLGLVGVIGKNDNVNTVTNTPVNANSATNSTGADVVRTLDTAVAYRAGVLTADRAESRNAVGGFAATAGTKFVVVYFEPSALNFDEPFVSWLTNEIALLDSENTATKPTYAHMEGERAATAADNYLAFRVDADAEDFTMRFLRDGEDKRLTLGF